MNSPRATLKAFTDAAADAVAREIASLRRGAESDRLLREAEHRARMAELDARILSAAEVERRLIARLAELKDGEAGPIGQDGKDGEPGPVGADGPPGPAGEQGPAGKDGENGADGRDGVDGKDGRDGHDVEDITAAIIDETTFEIGFTVGETRSTFQLELPRGVDGKDGERGDKGDPGSDGKLSIVTPWTEDVHYEGALRSHAGGTWQAMKDTAKEPPHEDWICIAAAGINGADGRSLNPRRLYAPAEEYKHLDVVALNGGSFVALKDDPGPCPGEGWMLLTQQGKRGEKGERGDKGDRGERGVPGEPIVAAAIDENGMLTLINGDGSKVQCDLYPVLTKIGAR